MFLAPLSSVDRLKVKRYLHQHPDILQPLQLGSYIFSGNYSPETFVATINAGPKKNFEKITILEGRSIYDTDAMLTKKGLISAGEYTAIVSNIDTLQNLRIKYSFVDQFLKSKNSDTSPSLE